MTYEQFSTLMDKLDTLAAATVGSMSAVAALLIADRKSRVLNRDLTDAEMKSAFSEASHLVSDECVACLEAREQAASERRSKK